MEDYQSDKDLLEFRKIADHCTGVLVICQLLLKKGFITPEEYLKCITELRENPGTKALFEAEETLSFTEIRKKEKKYFPSARALFPQSGIKAENENSREKVHPYRHKPRIDFSVGNRIVQHYKDSGQLIPALFTLFVMITLFVYMVKN